MRLAISLVLGQAWPIGHTSVICLFQYRPVSITVWAVSTGYRPPNTTPTLWSSPSQRSTESRPFLSAQHSGLRCMTRYLRAAVFNIAATHKRRITQNTRCDIPEKERNLDTHDIHTIPNMRDDKSKEIFPCCSACVSSACNVEGYFVWKDHCVSLRLTSQPHSTKPSRESFFGVTLCFTKQPPQNMP